MNYYLMHYVSTGEIFGHGFCAEVDIPKSSGEVSIMKCQSPPDPKTQFISPEGIAIRPTTNLPETHAIPASTDWILSDVPAGTEVEVDGEIVGTTDVTGLTLNFAAPGVWPVTLRPPFPWVEASCEVTVT